MATPGILLVQVGTPDAPTTKAVRSYLAAFLGDPRVVDLNPWIWKPILHAVVLRTRPRRSAALYRRIWTEAGSPLLVHTEAQCAGLAARLAGRAEVRFGMRIGRPSLEAALDDLVAVGCERILALPLFPQYSTATTASVEDALDAWLVDHPQGPALETVRSFPDHAAWIDALVERVRASGFRASSDAPLILSFHGLPQRYADRGDPYPAECARTARALVATLGLGDDAWRLTYQSRFGRETWLRPYTDEVLAALPGAGIRTVGVITPAFVADCLETIDEIGRESRDVFERAGGTRFTRIECPNASPAFIDALARIVAEHDPSLA
jgi:ferrochelatase